jgi:hypothetical protein
VHARRQVPSLALLLAAAGVVALPAALRAQAPVRPAVPARGAAAAGSTDTAAVRAATDRVAPAMIEFRHDLHHHP